MFKKIVKKFGSRGAHILLPFELIGKEVEIRLINEREKEPEKQIVSDSEIPDKKVETKQQNTSKEEFKSLMEKVMKDNPQH
jgi:hypothetical protein